MRIFASIVVLVVVMQLTLQGAFQSSDAVLCVEADGHAAVEELGCDCTTDPTTGEDVDVNQSTVSPSGEHCTPCVDIPIGNGANRFAVRVVSKEKTEPNTLPSAELVHAIPEPTNSFFILTWALPRDRGNPITAHVASLRI